jgi:uncharacterized metal-binding protein YceD (DUF177 family)
MIMDTPAPLPLTWAIRVEDVPARSLDWTATATDAERQSIAETLDLIDVARLTANGKIEGLAGGIYRLTGRLKADIVQPCVITLDPVPAKIDEPIAIEFRPTDLVEDELASTPDYDEAFEIEPIVHGRLETGRVIYELLSASLDPYPRAVGADMKDITVQPPGGAPINPFAVLAKLKPKA